MDEKLTIGSITQLTAQTGPGLIGVPLGGEGAMWMAGEPAREIARLKAELEALRKDAERYRWLQKTTAGAGFQWKATGPDDSLDKAIDRAMVIEAVGAA